MTIKSIQWQTNKIEFEEKEGKKLVIKKFDSVKPTLLFSLYNLANFFDSMSKLKLKNDFYFPSTKKRIENEIRAREVLSQLGFKFPRICWYDKNSIGMEKVEGEKLPDFYKNAKIELVYEISKKIGGTVRKIHDCGFSFLDRRSENYIIKDCEVYNLDLEFFTKATEFGKMCDTITYDSSILNLEPKKCETVIEAFHEGYSKNLTNNEIIYILFFSTLYPFSLKENLIELTNRNLNAYRLVRKLKF